MFCVYEVVKRVGFIGKVIGVVRNDKEKVLF